MKHLISFDLDMTLLDHATYSIPESAMRSIDILRKKGYIIVLATGRDMDAYYSVKFRELIAPDAIIHMNGAKITVGPKVIYEHFMDKELVKRILEYAKRENIAVGATIGEYDYYTHPEIITAQDMKLWGESGRRYKDPGLLMEMGTRTMAYIGSPDGAKKLENEFDKIKLPLFAKGAGADIIEDDSSKALGLKRLCEYMGVNMDDTIAFGDSMNDIEIIKEANIGIAMGNAVDEVKNIADYVTTAIDDDGIWNACKYYKFIEEDM